MRKKDFTSSVSTDCTTADQVKESLELAVDELHNHAIYLGYEPLWQTFAIRSEEYSVDNSPMVSPNSVIERYIALTAEVMGVKE